VLQQGHVRAELAEQQGLVNGGGPGGQDADALVPDLLNPAAPPPTTTTS